MLTIHRVREAVLESRPMPQWTFLRDCVAADATVLAALRSAPTRCLTQGQLMNLLARIVVSLIDEAAPTLRERGVVDRADYDIVRTLLLRDGRKIRQLLQQPNQTNNPMRAAALYPAFAYVSRWVASEIALVEIGPSMGLNLCWDKYRLDYGELGMFGDPDSTCRLHYTLRSTASSDVERTARWLSTPRLVALRIGLELHPIAENSANERLWLAGAGPATRAAVTITRQVKPRIVPGDAVDTLLPALDTIPASVTPVIYSSFVTYQLATRKRQRLEQLVGHIGRSRPVVRIRLGEHPNKRGARLDVRYVAPGIAHCEILGFCNMDGDCGSAIDLVASF